jgi:uncharacterized iron-regulated protein
MRRYLTVLILISFFFLGAKNDRVERPVFRVADGKVISFEQMIEEIKKVTVVFVGELHDSAEDHRMQLELIKALHARGAPLAVGLEMFRAESQKDLDRWVSGASTLEQFLPAYYDNWRIAWPLYRDIFLYARESNIPLVGLNVPQDVTWKVAHKGFAALGPKDLKDLPPDISCNVDPRYMEFIKRAYSGHDIDEQAFVHFCEAQLVWDKSMAWHLVRYLKKNPSQHMVVLAGAGHAWKRGIPGQVKQLSLTLTYKVILPHIPGEIDKKHIHIGDADYVVLK